MTAQNDTRMPAIDLTRYHFMRPVGEFVVFGTWIWSEAEEDHEPALVIVPRHRRSGFKPCCVALSAAWKYNEPAYLARAASVFLQNLGMEDCMSNAHKVADAIHAHLGDLVSMPPNPTRGVVVADASMTIDGQRRSIELLDHVSLKQY